VNCTTVKGVIQEYLEGRLSQLERNELVSHVDECAACEEEVLAYREMFGVLRELPRQEAPSRVTNAVMAHFAAEGAFKAPTTTVSVLGRFLALPAAARYPLAAAMVIAALYVPLAAALGLMRGSVTSLSGRIAEAYVAIQGAMGGISVLASFFESLTTYTRAFRTILQAFGSLVSRGDGALIVAIAVAVVFSVALALLIGKRRKSVHHATYSL
jgi:hypothetical protein